jgi:small subunit ribosomal protein S16
MLTIRLQRAGKKNHPEYRVVLAQTTASASKKFVEILGNYNPHTKTLGIRKPERLNYWISQHVSMSPTVHNLFVSNKLIEGDKVRAFNVPKKEVAQETAPETAAASPVAEATEPAPAPDQPATPADEPVTEPTPAAPEAVAEVSPEEPAA